MIKARNVGVVCEILRAEDEGSNIDYYEYIDCRRSG